MNLSEPFIRRPAGTSLLALGILLMGIVAYYFLPIAPVPRVDYPVVTVGASLPGGDPATMASTVAAPLERRLGQIPGISEMTSNSSLGSCGIAIQFDLDRKIEGAARDVQAAISGATGELPTNLPSPPSYHKINAADSPIMIISLTSDLVEPTRIYDFSDAVIGQRLSQVKGVSQVVVSGAEKSAIRIQMNPAALALTGLGLEDIRNILESANADLPKGSIEAPGLSYMIDSNDQMSESHDFGSMIVGDHDGVPIVLSSLGRVIRSVENDRQAGWAGNKPAVLVIVYKQADANIIETVDGIKAVLPQLKRWLPPSVNFEVSSDRTVTIRASVREVEFTLMLSVGLVVLVMLLFLRRLWPTLIASMTVPLALAGTFVGMYLCGYSLDNLSLMALTISVGFVVDDAIVVIENIFRFVEEGDTPLQAALKGSRQIGFTVISISLSLIAVFIPLLFMGGLMGRLLHEFSVTLSMAIVVSAVISLTLTPSLCACFLKSEHEMPKPGRFMTAISNGLDAMNRGYEKSLRWVLRHEYTMLAVALLTMAATVWLYDRVSKGFFPRQDTGMMMATTEASQDISFKAMVKLQQQACKLVMDDSAVATVNSFISSTAPNFGHMYIDLKPLEVRGVGAEEVIERLRKKASQIVGLDLYMFSRQDVKAGGRSSKSFYQYSLQGPDLAELNYWAPKVLAALQKVPNLRDVTSDQQTRGLQSNVVIDRDSAARLGVSLSEIDNTLYDAFGQRQVSVMYQQYNQHHVVLEVEPKYLNDPSALNRIFVRSTNGPMVPLGSVAHFTTGNTFLSVNHQGQFPCITLSFNLPDGVSLGDVTDSIQKAVLNSGMPGSINASFQGTAKMFQAAVGTLPVLIVAALITVYIVLGMLYESLVHPLTILSTLPSAGVGALLALIYFNYELSIVSFIGIILLMGIVKKNAIMMIDFALEAERHDHLTPEEAIFRACCIRFRPIMMTTLAALFGSLPLAIGQGLGSELRRPLGISVVGGLIVSQVLTLYTTPVIYVALDKLSSWVKSLHFYRAAAPSSAAVPEGTPELPPAVAG